MFSWVESRRSITPLDNANYRAASAGVLADRGVGASGALGALCRRAAFVRRFSRGGRRGRWRPLLREPYKSVHAEREEAEGEECAHKRKKERRADTGDRHGVFAERDCRIAETSSGRGGDTPQDRTSRMDGERGSAAGDKTDQSRYNGACIRHTGSGDDGSSERCCDQTDHVQRVINEWELVAQELQNCGARKRYEGRPAPEPRIAVV